VAYCWGKYKRFYNICDDLWNQKGGMESLALKQGSGCSPSINKGLFRDVSLKPHDYLGEYAVKLGVL